MTNARIQVLISNILILKLVLVVYVTMSVLEKAFIWKLKSFDFGVTRYPDIQNMLYYSDIQILILTSGFFYITHGP